jgi:hypothetical protein
MRRVIRENAPCALVALAGSAATAWLGLYGYAWSDYEVEAQPAVGALLAGHVSDFLRLAPAYGGSLVERAPFALLAQTWGGGQLAVYRLLALPCLLAAVVLAVCLLARMRSEGRSLPARAVVLALCVANPITLRALELGHPEELLGACLCVAAVLAAASGRPLAAGILVGLAIANKEWAVLALGPVVLAVAPGRRLACLVAATAVASLVLAPLILGGSGAFAASARAVSAPSSAIFQPWQLWWFLGHHGPLVHGLFGSPKPGYRIGPAWTGRVSHPLIVLAAAAITAGLWLRGRLELRRAPLGLAEALLALALLLLLRCLLDTWDAVYYPLPFVLALLAFEASAEPRRPPVLAAASTALVWISFQWLPQHASADVQSAAFLAWSLPLGAGLAVRLWRSGGGARVRARGERAAHPQETTVSSLGRLVSTS